MSLLALPMDVLRWMCCAELSPMEISRMRRVCRHLHAALSADSIWRALYLRYWAATDRRVLLVPQCATENLAQRQRFNRSERAAAMTAARDRVCLAPIAEGEPVYASFCRALETYRLAVWPSRVFYIGLAEAGCALVTAGQLRAPIARVATHHESNGRLVSPNGRRLEAVSPASVPGSARSVFRGGGDHPFAADAFPALMHRLDQDHNSPCGGVAVLIEPACGFAQSRPLIANAIRASQSFTGSPYWGIVDLPRVLVLALRREQPQLVGEPLVVAAMEGDELWSVVVDAEGVAVRATYHGFNPRVQKKDPQQQMRKLMALKLMKMDASETGDGEQRMLTKEHALARHVWSSCSVFATMTQSGTVAAALLGRVVLVGGPRVALDVALFSQHCKQLSGLPDSVCVTVAQRDLLSLAFAGACVLSRNFEWCPTPL